MTPAGWLKLTAGAVLVMTAMIYETTSFASFLDKMAAPPIKADPTTSGLVVVQCDATLHGLLGSTGKLQMSWGRLLSTDGKTKIDGEVIISLDRTIQQLIIFQNVPPGTYRLAMVEGYDTAFARRLPSNLYKLPEDKEYTIIAEVEKPTYLGVVTIDENTIPGQQKTDFTLKPGKEAEIAAWEKFLSVYDNIPWTNLVQKRLSELKNNPLPNPIPSSGGAMANPSSAFR